ncbi:hypothetical protein OPV22_029704 [Ensete ventricosum]|uniref:Uncharacterized protein n=1 Tax=Ensete ventricosum TaxID=4639 RepID=A0AAV8Q1V7_ENSVE|nr:hypothetical protein OPV22_029704 [Ensete ventricosum]
MIEVYFSTYFGKNQWPSWKSGTLLLQICKNMSPILRVQEVVLFVGCYWRKQSTVCYSFHLFNLIHVRYCLSKGTKGFMNLLSQS